MKVLLWVTCTKRPLQIEELRHALAIKRGDTLFNTLNLSEVDLLVGVCIGLVGLDQQSNTLRLIHYTLHDCLQTKQIFLDGDSVIAGTFLTYLSFDGPEQRVLDSHTTLREEYPLYFYTSYLLHHFSPQIQPELHDAIIFLFTRNPKTTTLRGFWSWGSYKGSALHTAVACALVETTQLLLTQLDPNIKDNWCGRPLHYLADRGVFPDRMLYQGSSIFEVEERSLRIAQLLIDTKDLIFS